MPLYPIVNCTYDGICDNINPVITDYNKIQSIEDKYIIKFIKTSRFTDMVVTDEGRVFVKGWDLYGQLGTELENVYSIIVTENNEIYFSGRFKYLFNDKAINKFTKVELNINENIKLVRCFKEDIFIVTENNNIYLIGDNKFNQSELIEEYFIKIDKFIDNNNNDMKSFLQIVDAFSFSDFYILGLNGDIYRYNENQYFIKIDLPFKVKKMLQFYKWSTDSIFLTDKNELYLIFENYKTQLIINDINFKKIKIVEDCLFVTTKDNKIFYNTVFNVSRKESMKLLCTVNNYKYIQFIDKHIYYNNYKININKIKITNLLNYTYNFNMDNIFNLLKNKYLYNQSDLINIILNNKNISINFMESFYSKEYNYNFSFIILFKLILLHIILIHKQNLNINIINIKEHFNIILKTIYLIINKSLFETKQYKINSLINIFKNFIIHHKFSNLSVDLELIYYLHKFIKNINSLQELSSNLENKELETIFKNELKINVENNKFIMDNKYLLISKLGDGGFGIVFKAFNIVTLQYCALKILFENSVYNNLLEEINLISKLKHENIIEYLDYEEQNESLLPLLDFQNELNEKDEIIKELQIQLIEKDEIINEKDNQLMNNNIELTEKNKQLLEKEKEKDKLLDKIKELELQVTQLQQNLFK
ncbi:hypothetical protein ABK040_002717 [Willaertia magna]